MALSKITQSDIEYIKKCLYRNNGAGLWCVVDSMLTFIYIGADPDHLRAVGGRRSAKLQLQPTLPLPLPPLSQLTHERKLSQRCNKKHTTIV